MPLAAPIKNSFNGGEFSPLVFGRTDYNKYGNGTSLMQNFLPQVQGGMTRRVGSIYTSPTKGNNTARLVRFVFSTGDAIMMEFSDFFIRFYRNRAPVYETAQAISGITQANPAVVTYVGADNYTNGREVNIRDVVGMTQVNGGRYVVANVNTAANTFELKNLDGTNVNSTGWSAYTSGGNVEQVYQVASPYAIADVPFLRFQQSRDVMYIAHPSYAPRKLIRAALTSWSFSTVAFLDGPYLQANSTATTLTPAATTGAGVNVTASSTTGINDNQGFLATDVGRFIRIKHSTTWGYAQITSRTSATVVVVTIVNAFGATTASANWRLGEWSDTTLYPSVVFSFEDRLGWAASPIAPTTLNMSNTGDYENMAPTGTDSTVVASNALQIRINSKQQDPIRWVVDDEKGLLVGTKGGEYVIRTSVSGESMSAINFPAGRRSTKHGSANVEPVEAGKAVLFAQTAKRKIREFAYQYEVDGFKAPDLTLLAEHMTKGNIAQMCFQQEPFGIVWVRLENGQLRGMTYDRGQDVVGWHRHPFGGFYDSGATDRAHVESIECLPAPDGSQDDLWLVVARYINGGVKRYVEYLSNFNTDYDAVKDCYFVDGGKVIDLGSSGTLVTGLNHLIGQTVSLLVDGSPQADKVVNANGEIILDRAGRYVMVGLGYVSRMKTLRPDAGSANGTSQGKTKRTHKLAARLHQTVGIKVGRDFTENGVTMDQQDFRPGNHKMDQAVPMFSGDKLLDFEDDYTTDGYIAFEQTQPLPCTLLALMPRIMTQDAA